MSPGRVLIGCAGWSLPSVHGDAFPGEGSHLERYARVLAAVEINSSFYRPHQAATYARWRASVPPTFRFSVKLPRSVTHDARLAGTQGLMREFLGPVRELGGTLGCLLAQLPPSLAFDAALVDDFFAALREQTATGLACEPRHASWFTETASEVLARHRVAFVRAHPPPTDTPPPPGWSGMVYVRLHGAPRLYYSAYDVEFIARGVEEIATLAASGIQTWCIFDNTAHGHCLPNALRLLQGLRGERLPQRDGTTPPDGA